MNATTPATSPLYPVFAALSSSLSVAEDIFYKIPGSQVVARYVKSSHRNDPGRTALELILVVFAIWTLMKSRTRKDGQGKHFISFNEKEIDDLVADWTPEPLGKPLSEFEKHDLAAVPIIQGPNGPRPKLASNGKTVLNLASFNFTGLAGNENIKERAIETLRKYGLGSCGPPGFYGTVDVHMDFERDVADFLGTEAAILYSQGFSTVSSVIPAFCKRGDIIVADRSVNFAIQKGIQISRSTVRWYDHNDMNSLQEVLESVDKERKKRGGPLTRRFIVTEGIFEQDGKMSDLPKLIELKLKYKYRLLLDESFSFGTVGRTGRGLTELYNVPAAQVDMLCGNVSIGLASGGGFCAGSSVVVEHQRINGTSFVFSASMPPLLAVSASEGIAILRAQPSILATLQENVRAIHTVLAPVTGTLVTIPSHAASPVIHIHIKPQATSALAPGAAALIKHSKSNPASVRLPVDPLKGVDMEAEEKLLQEIVEECLNNGVWVTRAKRLRGQELVEPRASIRLSVTAALSRKETEKAAGVLKAAITKVLGKRR
ncbi:serine palmitoyltransferase [Athelia psychrophila]|uniref:serine C-palmitoyltransferase n=1 Tax=Athelia psychrophila TaxID=1759441 RepID=A0A166TQT8_9AGAM|nr:serine palmitoyltransferase [Fibularhizoctonia sp. CBS 109695]KZP30877.1 serine palmitoyltransferase [Fibularhizoctonia sp. CBS 109695]